MNRLIHLTDDDEEEVKVEPSKKRKRQPEEVKKPPQKRAKVEIGGSLPGRAKKPRRAPETKIIPAILEREFSVDVGMRTLVLTLQSCELPPKRLRRGETCAVTNPWETLHLERAEVIDIFEDGGMPVAKVKDLPLAIIVILMLRALRKRLYFLEDPITDLAIEQQPMPGMRYGGKNGGGKFTNARMAMLSYCIYAFYVKHFMDYEGCIPNVHFASPKSKLKCSIDVNAFHGVRSAPPSVVGKTKYDNRKQMAVQMWGAVLDIICNEKVNRYALDNQAAREQFRRMKKADDLADASLQGLYQIQKRAKQGPKTSAAVLKAQICAERGLQLSDLQVAIAT